MIINCHYQILNIHGVSKNWGKKVINLVDFESKEKNSVDFESKEKTSTRHQRKRKNHNKNYSRIWCIYTKERVILIIQNNTMIINCHYQILNIHVVSKNWGKKVINLVDFESKEKNSTRHQRKRKNHNKNYSRIWCIYTKERVILIRQNNIGVGILF